MSKLIRVLNLALLPLLLICTPEAHGLPTISFTTGGATATCSDGDVCDGWGDVGTPDGVVVFAKTIGVFSVNVTTGISKPVIDNGLTLGTINVQSKSGANTLEIGFSDTGFTHQSAASGDFGGTLSGVAKFQYSAYFDTTDALFGKGTLVGMSPVITPGAFSGSFEGDVGLSSSPYSLTHVLKLQTTGLSVFSGSFNLTVMPEPATVTLLGGALLVIGQFARRRFKILP